MIKIKTEMQKTKQKKMGGTEGRKEKDEKQRREEDTTAAEKITEYNEKKKYKGDVENNVDEMDPKQESFAKAAAINESARATNRLGPSERVS